MDAPPVNAALEAIEVELLLSGLHEAYGHDFRGYARPSIARRIRHVVADEGLGSVSELMHRVLHDRDCRARLLLALTVSVTSMFRDPSFFAAFRQLVVPWLRTYPFIRIWHPGCSTGEEAYSIAIVLEEEGVYDRCRIYATDINDDVLRKAEAGIFPLSAMRGYAENYGQAAGARPFAEYYAARYDHAILRGSLKRNIVFGRHNLATDSSINEFHAILCRNVMIYFGKELQGRVHELLYSSLCRLGVLCLGSKEALQFTPREACYEPLSDKERIYRKVR